MNSQHHAQGIKLVLLHLRQEIAGIHKMESVHAPLLLSGVCGHQRHERVLLMGRFTAAGANRLFSVADLAVFDLSLSRPGTMQRQHPVILRVKIQRRRKYLRKIHRFFGMVRHAHAPRNDIHVIKCRVVQCDRKIQHFIRQHNLKRLTLFFAAERGRKSRKSRFARIDLMLPVKRLHRRIAVFVRYGNRTLPVIADAVPRILHRKRIQKRAPVAVIL